MARKIRRAGERRRDEQRRGGGPRMHGGKWHDHPEPRDMTPDLVKDEALPEAEGSGEHEGMGKGGSHGTGAGASRK
ncbi:MAG: hypothetical protein ACM31C_27105 [Acidobacteriota bacterium]